MTEGQIHYGFAQLQGLAADINGKSGQLRSSNDELLGYVQGLRAQWESGAQQSYDVVQNKWQQAHTDIIQVLQTISRTVEQAANDMQHTDQRNAGSWGGH